MYISFKTRGLPIVGTSLDYFDFRKLKITEGRSLALLGECILGSSAAEKLGLGPGDSLVSSPENLFDLAGVYPLKMKIVGILEKSHSPDDLAVFVDLKTAWIIEGLMHGHQDVTKTPDSTVILKQEGKNVAANAKLFQYAEITEKNMGQFHFHGDPATYPVTAVIAVPFDKKSGTILRGRFVKKGEILQIVKPEEVIDGLLQNIFRIKNILDAVITIVGAATVLAIFLVFSLSLRLRQRELQTIFKLGCQKLTVARLLGAEIFIIAMSSAAICTILVFTVHLFANDLVRSLVVR
jgi:putative ABC transport system permease protein